MRAALFRFPNSGLSPRAAGRVLDRVAERDGAAAAILEAERLERALRGSELEERLGFERASRLERAGNSPLALAAYLDLARRFPYPLGAYWDDSLTAAARLELGFGRPQRAILLLERVLAERERARISGSYERKSFAEARFRIAEIARDHLGDRDRAQREFHRVWTDHPTSRLGDDALFEEALLAVASGDREAACASAKLFAERARDSRYARCVRELCPGMAARSGRACPSYAVERLPAGGRNAAADASLLFFFLFFFFEEVVVFIVGVVLVVFFVLVVVLALFLVSALVVDFGLGLQIDADLAQLCFQQLEQLIGVIPAPFVENIGQKLEKVPIIQATFDLFDLILGEGLEDIFAERLGVVLFDSFLCR